MKWEKKGLIYCPDGTIDWMKQFAMLPTPLLINESTLRLFVGFCDINVRKFKDADFDNYTSSYRGTKIKNINPDFPNNLQSYLLDKIKSNIIILMAFKKATIQLLEEMKLDYEIVLPDESKLEELKDIYKQRGDSDEYIEQNTTHRYKETLFLARQSGKVIRFVAKGLWLEDVIMEK